MKIKSLSAVFAVGLCTAMTGHAAASIDFVNEENASMTYRSVRCTATNSAGQSNTIHGQQNSLVNIVSLKNLLSGSDGKYDVLCTAQHAQSGENYTAELKAVKFAEGDLGSSAPEYDDNRKAYGVNIAASGLLSTCYDQQNLVLKKECLDKYYGNKPYYLEQIKGIEDVEARYHAYGSNVGVFLKRNTHINTPK